MINNYSHSYELASSDFNFPARIMLYDKAGKSCRIDKHKHRDVELDFIIRGNLKVNIAGDEKILRSNEFCLINSSDFHSTLWTDAPDIHIKYQVILLSYSFLKSYMPDFDDYRFELSSAEAYHEIATELRTINELIMSNGKFAELHILSSLIHIIDVLFSQCAVRRSARELQTEIPVYDYLSNAEMYIHEHYRESLTLEDIAGYIGLSKNYFAKYFKQKQGKTVMQYLGEVRLKNTIIDITNSDISETAAAMRNGFSSVKSFINTFKSVYHCTPSEYKRVHGDFPSSFAYVERRDRNVFE